MNMPASQEIYKDIKIKWVKKPEADQIKEIQERREHSEIPEKK